MAVTEQAMAPPRAPDEPGAPMRRPRWAVAATVVIGVMLAGLAAAVVVVRDRQADAAFAQQPDLVLTTSPLPAGTPFTLGSMFLANPQRLDLEILAVTPHVSDNVEVLGALALFPLPQRHVGVTGASGFPPEHPDPRIQLQPATGRVFPGAETRLDSDGNGEAIEIFVGMEARSGPVGGLNGVTVTYRLGQQVHERSFPYAVIMCVGQEPCERLDEEQTLIDLHLLGDAVVP